MKTLAFFFALISSFVFAAEPIAEPIKIPTLTVNRREYKKASVTKLDARLARVVHESGAARIPMELLPAELQTQLGFDAVAAAAEKAVAAEEQRKLDEAAARKKAVDKLPAVKFWVLSNTEEGLVVGNFEEFKVSYRGSGGSSLSSVGGGGGGGVGGYTKTTMERGDVYSFIPHTAETRNLTLDQEFHAKVQEAGTKRLDEETVVKNYQILALWK